MSLPGCILNKPYSANGTHLLLSCDENSYFFFNLNRIATSERSHGSVLHLPVPRLSNLFLDAMCTLPLLTDLFVVLRVDPRTLHTTATPD